MIKLSFIRKILLSTCLCATALYASAQGIKADSLRLYYPAGYRYVVPSYRNNATELNRFIESVKEADRNGRLEQVRFICYASPDGDYRANIRLATLRADSLAAYILRNTGIARDKIRSASGGIGYGYLAELVERDQNVPGRTEVLDILRNAPEFVSGDAAGTDKVKISLMGVQGGTAYRYMREHLFPEMRSCQSVSMYIKDPEKEDTPADSSVAIPAPGGAEQHSSADAVPVTEPAPAQPEKPQDAEPEDQPVIEEPVQAEDPAATPPAVRQPASEQPAAEKQAREKQAKERPLDWLNIKTNIPFYALVVPNLAVEFQLAPHWSLDFPVYYSPYTVARKYRFRTLAFQPSVRYWLRENMTGHFFGIHVTGGQFNVSVDDRVRYQDTDGMWGAGIDYGYALEFNPHWGIEFNIGAGYIWTRYDKFYNINNGAQYDTRTANYLGITRLGISLIYKL